MIKSSVFYASVGINPEPFSPFFFFDSLPFFLFTPFLKKATRLLIFLSLSLSAAEEQRKKGFYYLTHRKRTQFQYQLLCYKLRKKDSKFVQKVAQILKYGYLSPDSCSSIELIFGLGFLEFVRINHDPFCLSLTDSVPFLKLS